MSAAAACAVLLVSVFAFWPRTDVTAIDSKPPTAARRQITGSSRTPPTSKFDVDVQNLSDSVTQVEKQWRAEAAPLTVGDDWEPYYQGLKRDIELLEQEWSSLPAH